ncbi:unnamed protein product [Meganyctiphanes norvegica]|uniref:Uncharacterized protein n=1 Tax=Meganyctiphanes norvegica TaxID=48144 RepID=A0AAV2Q2W4_MEGNR
MDNVTVIDESSEDDSILKESSENDLSYDEMVDDLSDYEDNQAEEPEAENLNCVGDFADNVESMGISGNENEIVPTVVDQVEMPEVENVEIDKFVPILRQPDLTGNNAQNSISQNVGSNRPRRAAVFKGRPMDNQFVYYK